MASTCDNLLIDGAGQYCKLKCMKLVDDYPHEFWRVFCHGNTNHSECLRNNKRNFYCKIEKEDFGDKYTLLTSRDKNCWSGASPVTIKELLKVKECIDNFLAIPQDSSILDFYEANVMNLNIKATAFKKNTYRTWWFGKLIYGNNIRELITKLMKG